MSRTVDLDEVRRIAGAVVDPEIPVLRVDDLGLLREVAVDGDRVVVTITPTYSGCPAMDQIAADVREALAARGYPDTEVRITNHPAWSTDWISERGRRKLAQYGIAPPVPESEVLCPRCRSGKGRLVARFGSTACKALMVCVSCGEPFDWFKEF